MPAKKVAGKKITQEKIGIAFVTTVRTMANKTVDMIDTTCFYINNHDDETLKIGVKSNKTAAEIRSPEEPLHAFFSHVASRIEAGAKQKELDQWKRVLLSSPGRLVKVDTHDEQYFWSPPVFTESK